MTTSISSSHQSHLDDSGSVLSDVSNFEEISLDDVTTTSAATTSAARRPNVRDANLRLAIPKPHAPLYPSSDSGQASVRSVSSSRTLTRSRADVPQKFLPQREPPSPRGGAPNGRGVSPTGLSEPPRSPGAYRRPPMRTSTSSLYPGSLRSTSPSLLGPKDPNQILRPRRKSWQSTRDRKTVLELESQYDNDDDDDDDDIPDGLILDNVPISPRPTRDRPTSQPQSPLLLPQNVVKGGRSVGNGTPPVAAAQGNLRSPAWKSDTAISDSPGPGSEFPTPLQAKGRAKSWNIAMAGLSPEMKALTEKLEEHDDGLEERLRAGHDRRPATWDASSQAFDPVHWEPQLRKHSQLPELPPLRRTNVMIDPLPISKEKEAVLSRTRPSWLPPKDPAEERRHLKQYQKMMALSVDAERKKEMAKNAVTSRRDDKADSLMRIWEEDILPRWQDAIREPRTRELWWKGIAPRSRGMVWSKAIGNELGLSELSYTAALKRSREARERIKDGKGDAEDARRAGWFEAIKKDVSERTWPDLRIFQEGGPLHESLVDVLSAYAMYRGDIGYVPGCNTIAALLLLNLPNATDSFIALSNVLNRPIPLSFHAGDPGAKTSAYNLVLQTLKEKSAPLHDHLAGAELAADPDEYLSEVFAGLFTGSLAVDEAARLWDVYVFEGDTVLVRAAVALLVEEEGAILACKGAGQVGAVLAGAEGCKRKKRAVGEVGAEDRWMKGVREAGKAS
ncbi:related to Rab6 GTPase activating protein, GAPCenA [Cephalotrichum gorgonifer]|uniref:Related to Rab6 GTPase activating protein, GAPCenA n=1 Tax=Cephalotrichum gorgonifer TaxID=2041049 RepID=A0AAE8MQ61_9PEZI|nr:related to Rab6 GTPase activating protein, GAPCenA [Cephalotrichum gorgonifer]